MKTIFKGLATAALLGMLLLELNHSLLQKAAWSGFHPEWNYSSIFFVSLWVSAIVGIWAHAVVFKPYITFGFLGGLGYGVILAATVNRTGIFYVLASVAGGLCAAYGHGLFGERAQGATVNVLGNERDLPLRKVS